MGLISSNTKRAVPKCACGKRAILAIRTKERSYLDGTKRQVQVETGRTSLINRCEYHANSTHEILKKEGR